MCLADYGTIGIDSSTNYAKSQPPTGTITMDIAKTAEHRRLIEAREQRSSWRHWGPYLADRAWGTVREDYSADREPWRYFPHDHARSRAYRWGEDGIGGVCNQFQNLCMAVAFWNGSDAILKERLFGVSGEEGNHGEDVKELYFYLDATPTHSYLKMLYKYPQVAYPYADLVQVNRRRSYGDPEYEITEALAEAWEERRYFDITIEWAKASAEDLVCRIIAINRGPDAAPLHILPHLWARNTWSWGHSPERPVIEAVAPPSPALTAVHAYERHLSDRWWYVAAGDARPDLLFTENDTNVERLYGTPNPSPYVKDAIHAAVVDGCLERCSPAHRGTKVAAHAQMLVPSGGAFEVWVRFSDAPQEAPFVDLPAVFEERIAEADAFYDVIHRSSLGAEERLIQRQALAGLCWTQQYYHFSVELWLDGDPAMPTPPPGRRGGRNAEWRTHLYSTEVLSMPDKWEFPWFAAWDLAFHAVAVAMIDADFAKFQLTRLLREWYQHPNGQLPAYEWDFSDANPPVHAWAVWRVYQISRSREGVADRAFLESAFHKLLLNFTWWVNQKDSDGNNVFQGGFLGLDNIGVFDRSKPLPTGGFISQADGTAWMAMYSLNMLRIAIELAQENPAYEGVASKFYEHFVYISYALAHLGHGGRHEASIWDESDGFYYDVLHMPSGDVVPMKVRSKVGLTPLYAVEVIDGSMVERLPDFRRRVDWLRVNRPHLVANCSALSQPEDQGQFLFALPDRDQLVRVLQRVLDDNEFLSSFGVRSLSRYHEAHPYTFYADGIPYSVGYEPGESRSNLFGGNSNWRGPIWFPTNYLLIESLRKYDRYYGDDLRVEYPTGSGKHLRLGAVADDLSSRLISIFRRDAEGWRPVQGGARYTRQGDGSQDLLLFHEYFHADTGSGLGASHQTGWTALVAKLLDEIAGGENCACDDVTA